MTVNKCPICGKPTIKEKAPFCSKACTDIDLVRWFHGYYTIAATEDEEFPNEDDANKNLHIQD